MLSILIPTYNYDILPLVSQLHKQATQANIDFEIRVQEDDKNSSLVAQNAIIDTWKNCYYDVNDSRQGWCLNRNILIEKSKGDKILFLDVDTLPVNNNFISTYVELNLDENPFVFGGWNYKENYEKGFELRYFYGVNREAIPLHKRINNPYNTAFTSNLYYKKSAIPSLRFESNLTKYGYDDILFINDIKKNNKAILHIENPIYHLGLEKSEVYFNKVIESVLNLSILYKQNQMSAQESKIIKTFQILQKYYLTSLFVFFFTICKPLFRKNILSAKPSLFYLDLYKLGTFCLAMRDSR